MNSLYTMSLLIPFSLFEINFRDSFEWKFKSYRVKPRYKSIITFISRWCKLLDEFILYFKL
jgi:hypothetical protein